VFLEEPVAPFPATTITILTLAMFLADHGLATPHVAGPVADLLVLVPTVPVAVMVAGVPPAGVVPTTLGAK